METVEALVSGRIDEVLLLRNEYLLTYMTANQRQCLHIFHICFSTLANIRKFNNQSKLLNIEEHSLKDR